MGDIITTSGTELHMREKKDFRHTFNALDLAGSKTGEGSPVLGPGNASWANRPLDIHYRSAH